MHENIYYNDNKSPCGAIGYICNHCEDARKKITVEYIKDKINLVLSLNKKI